MSITSDFSKFKKIDAHSHIGTFGSPFNIHFNADLLLKQMEEFNIEKTILCSDGPHTNEETVAAFKAHPDKIIPLMWINCAEGKPAYDALEHYIRDEHFAGAKLQSLFDGYCADDPCVDPVAEICEKYGKPLFIHSGHPPFSLPWQIGLLAERHPHLPIVMIHMGHAHGVALADGGMGDVLAVEHDFTRRCRYQAQHRIEGCGFSRTVGADQCHNAALRCGNIHIMNGNGLAVHDL